MLTCIDGRVQRPLDEWVRANLDVEYVDTITEPGPSRVLAESAEPHLAALLEKVAVSRAAHGSATLVLAAHSDCAGNPIPDEQQHRQLRDAVGRLARRLPGTRILAVHAGRCGERCWNPELVAEAPDGSAGEPGL
jgi:hypothetical protein